LFSQEQCHEAYNKRRKDDARHWKEQRLNEQAPASHREYEDWREVNRLQPKREKVHVGLYLKKPPVDYHTLLHLS
jgi:hypothetical protein